MTTKKKKFKLRDLEVDRVDIVARGANQHSHIVIAKSDRTLLDAVLAKHASHDQSTHGNRDGSSSPKSPGSRKLRSFRIKVTDEDGTQHTERVDAVDRGAAYRAVWDDFPSLSSMEDVTVYPRQAMDTRNPRTGEGSLSYPRDMASEIRRAGRGDELLPKDVREADKKLNRNSKPRPNWTPEEAGEWIDSIKDAGKGSKLTITRPDGKVETHWFASEKEATDYADDMMFGMGSEARETAFEIKTRKTMRPDMTTTDLIAKNAMMGYPPPQQPMDPAAMVGAQPPGPGMDRAGLMEFLRARLAAMPQTPGLPPGMVAATPPPQMPGQVPSPMGAVPQAPSMPQMPMGLPQPGSIAPGMPQPAPAPQAPQPQAPQPQAPGAPDQKPPGEKGMPKTSGDLAAQLQGARGGMNPGNPAEEPAPEEAKKKPFDQEDDEEEDSKRPPFGQKKKTNPFA